MTFISILLGIIFIVGGFSCMFTPLATFLNTGYFFCILLFIYGIIGIVRFCGKRAGVWELIISILAVIAGITVIFYPGESLVFDKLALIFIGCWLIIQGILSIVSAIQNRATRKGWGWGIVIGIIGILAGIYSFAHPVVTAMTAGVLIGLYFVQAGFDLIFFGTAFGQVKTAVVGAVTGAAVASAAAAAADAEAEAVTEAEATVEDAAEAAADAVADVGNAAEAADETDK